MRSLVKVGYRCNSDCRFCHAQDERGLEAGPGRVEALIRRAAALGHGLVALSGGELSLRDGVRRWAALSASLGMDLGLVTNGTTLDEATVSVLLRHRLRYVHLSLHGGTAEVHEALAGARSFEAVRRALGLLAGRGLELWVNCVVAVPNLDRLREVVDALLPYPGLRLKFSLVEPRGGAGRDFDELVPDVAAAAARVAEAVAHADAAGLAGTGHDGLPLCLLPGLEDRRSDLRAHGFVTMAEVHDADLCPVDAGDWVQPPRCRGCALAGRCPGLAAGVLRRRGDAALRPVTGGPRPNAFHWTYEGEVVGGEEGRCPILSLGVSPWDRGRHLFVRNRGRVGRFRTDTRDFTDAAVADVKHRAGQVYFDASGREAPDDFARQLVKLQRSVDCLPCPERDRCTGLFEPAVEELFSRDDARVLEILGGLEGEVLDVGSGEGPYGARLAEAAGAGRLAYTGVEPDEARAAAARARWPWARIVEARAEELELPPASVDHVLVLRSWNHLRDPEEALRRLLAAARPGGTFTVVDNEAFGLARSRAQTARAERSGAAFEHWRNDSAAEAHARIAGVAGRRLSLVERRDVAPATSNQWLLRYAVEPGGGRGA